jgi:hypothetical protein
MLSRSWLFPGGPPDLLDVNGYIQRQGEHHRQEDFKSELIKLLERAGIEYDARYLE